MNKFEENIKQSLENFEVPYDPKAWEKLSKKLDQQENKPNQKSTKGFNNFLFVGATTLIVVGIYFITNQKNTILPSATKNVVVTENNTQQELKKPTTEIEVPTKKTSASVKINDENKQLILEENKRTLHQKDPNKIEKKESIVSNEPLTETNNFKTSSTQIKEVEIPKTKSTYCENEAILITNTNSIHLYLINEKGRKMYKIPAKGTNKYTIKESGRYEWLNEENGNKTYKAFEIVETPNSNFSMSSELEFTDGFPKINCSTSSNTTTTQWFLNNKLITSNKELSIAIFTKGLNSISLKVENNAGCKSTTVKTMNVEDNYNLLAVTGFEPNHHDSKRNSFIPFALTVRNIPFKMVIIDPKNDKVIFETTDSSKPWDGIDQTTNEMVPENTTYIWKVTLYKTEKNEKSDYVGKITRI
jgi:hypothetical protein